MVVGRFCVGGKDVIKPHNIRFGHGFTMLPSNGGIWSRAMRLISAFGKISLK
jgi:hypothetical protein